jgi:N-acetylmuramoyl-L-alanine amidase
LANRPGLLVEVGFMSNSRELQKMLSKKFQKAYANALARGIGRYIDREIGVPEVLF